MEFFKFQDIPPAIPLRFVTQNIFHSRYYIWKNLQKFKFIRALATHLPGNAGAIVPGELLKILYIDGRTLCET
jgi:hypothetical protein